MYWVLIILMAVAAGDIGSSTIVNGGKTIFCSRAAIKEVRIQGCKREPCTLKKGKHLPFEIDFSFQAPNSTNEIDFQVFIPYWNKPGTGAYGSFLASARDCKGLQLKECPAKASTPYTLKLKLYADPKLKSTTSNRTTGKVTTGWMLTPITPHETEETEESSANESSQCAFNVEINLVK